MIRICAYCRRQLHLSLAIGEPLPNGWEASVDCDVSHGICLACLDEHFGDEVVGVGEASAQIGGE